MKNHFVHHQHYSNETFEYIYWFERNKAAKNLHVYRQIWLTTFTSGFCATDHKIKNETKGKPNYVLYVTQPLKPHHT